MSLSLLFPFAVKRSRASTQGCRPLDSLLVPARAGCGRGLLTATARGVGALGLAVTGLDHWIDTGHTVTGGGLLTAPGRVISVRVFPALWSRGRLPGSCPLASGGARTAGQTWNPGGC